MEHWLESTQKKCPPGPAGHVAVRPSRWLVRRIQRFGCFLGKLVFAVMTLVSTVISRAPRHPGRSLVLLLLAAKDASTVRRKRILKSGSSRGGFAGSRGHDSSKEVNHGSFAPRTSQIRAELAEIDHARHQNGEVSDAHSGEADVAIQGTFSVAHETRRGPAGYLHHDCRVLVLAALPSLTHIFLQPRRQPSKYISQCIYVTG